ncbi:hypothetical protein ABES21_21275 [Peribacillus frigoritolerans]|uniref:hypothetical protein n=1 Tax=Peribacillus frigoritolerans TaxID=450367 RepID=UPI003D2DB5CF
MKDMGDFEKNFRIRQIRTELNEWNSKLNQEWIWENEEWRNEIFDKIQELEMELLDLGERLDGI